MSFKGSIRVIFLTTLQNQEPFKNTALLLGLGGLYKFR